MYTETEGIILKQIKAVNGRRMVLLFSEKYGKISAGTSISERGRTRAALAMRPFTHGRYDLYRGRDTYHINGAEVIKAYYGIGEDPDKYMHASYALEFTERLLSENAPDTKTFKLLIDFFDIMETRKKEYMTVTIAFQLKAMQIAGVAPELGGCIRCGAKEGPFFLSVRDGGLVCGDCRNIIISQNNDELLYSVDFDIIKVLYYFFENGLKSIGRIALNEKLMKRLNIIIKEYRAYHLDIEGLKSEDFLKN